MLKGKNVLLGVTGSIAAYKCAYLIRLLKKNGAEVKVIQTKSSIEFITPLTLSTLSENKVLINMFDKDVWNNHVKLGLWADLFIIAPATAKTISDMVCGNCNSMLVATYLSAKCPVYFAPAMDLEMYKHFSTSENIKKLTDNGNYLIPPETGDLASGLYGKGRMAEPENIIKFIENKLNSKLKLSGKKILITAGPTYEHIDPIRFIANKSTGKMGLSLAIEAARNGAEVKLVLGPTHLECEHNNIITTKVETAEDMYKIVKKDFKKYDIGIFSAAVSDFKIHKKYKNKIKKNGNKLNLTLVNNIDILTEISKIKSSKQLIVGFALETQNELNNAKKKLQQKNLDMIILNSLKDKGAGFSYDTNKITIIDKQNNIVKFKLKSKSEVAKDIISYIYNLNS